MLIATDAPVERCAAYRGAQIQGPVVPNGRINSRSAAYFGGMLSSVLLRSTTAEFGFHQKVSLSRRFGHLALAQMLRLAEA
jgi:hypothetical protein